MSRTEARVWRAVGAIALAAVCVGGGCAKDPRRGYSFASTFPANIRTVAVPMFANSTMQTGVEAEVTEAVIKEIQRSTPMRVTGESGADSVLVGVVRSVQMRRLSLDRQTGMVQEVAVQITVDFDWTDRRTGKVLASRRGLTTSDTFVAARPSRESVETGEISAANRLAHELTGEMRGGW